MKKLLGILGIVLALTLIFPAAALADDPPDTDVDVVVVTPGDVDLSVDVNAGGNANVTIDGVPLASTISSLSGSISWVSYELSLAQKSLNELWNAYNAGIPLTQAQIDSLKKTTGLLSEATAMLIVKFNDLNVDMDNVFLTLTGLQKATDALDASIDTLQTQVDANQNAFDTFSKDTKTNFNILTGAINDLNKLTEEQDVKIKSLSTQLMFAVIVLGITLVLAVVGLVLKRKTPKL